LYGLDYAIRRDAPEPLHWLKTLSEWFPGDAESIATIQEFFGYALTPDTRHQKILMLYGESRSGKGTVARIMTALVGEHNVTGASILNFRSNFGLQDFVGKLLAIFSDAQLKWHDSAVVERMLNISGEDRVTVDRKYRDPVSIRLKTRLVYICNELPPFDDESGALANRMLISHFKQSFKDREDLTLEDRLKEELPGILLWAVAGWKRLIDKGRFRQPSSGREALEELKDKGNPVRPFVRECCRTDGPYDETPRQVIYEVYKDWCQNHGVRPLPDTLFGKKLKRCVRTLGDKHATIDGKRVWCYTGIALLNPPFLYDKKYF
jgi:putative DNA primase/helicase